MPWVLGSAEEGEPPWDAARGKDGTGKGNGGCKASCGCCRMGGTWFPSRGDTEQDDTEGNGNVTRLTWFFTHGRRAAPLGSMEGPNAGTANPHLPHLRPLQLCLDTVVHDLDSDLTVRHLRPQEGGSHQHRLLSLGAPEVSRERGGRKVRAWSSGWGHLPGSCRARGAPPCCARLTWGPGSCRGPG